MPHGQPGEQRRPVRGEVGGGADLGRAVDLEAGDGGVGQPAGDRGRAAVQRRGEAPVGGAHRLGGDGGLVDQAGPFLVAVHLLDGQYVGVQRGDRLGERITGLRGVVQRTAVGGQRLTVQQIEGGDAQLAHTARRYPVGAPGRESAGGARVRAPGGQAVA